MKVYVAIILVDYFLCYHKTQANAILVNTVGLLNETKQFEQFGLILLFYSYSRVNNFNFQEIDFISYDEFDTSLDCELDGVWLQAENDLSQPLLVGLYQLLLFKAFVFSCQIYVFILSLNFLDGHHHLDTFFDVESVVSLPKLPSLELRIVKHVVN